MPKPVRSPIWGTTRKCENCGKTFEPKSVAHKFCSHECYYVHHRAEQNETRKKIRRLAGEAIIRTVVCKSCGKEFTTRNYRLVYCSPECRIAGAKSNSRRYWQAYKKSIMTTATCVMCGKEFTRTLGARTKFCPVCRKQPKKTELVKPDPDRLNRKIREAQEKHISYGMLQVIAAREAAKEARQAERQAKEKA